MALPSSLTRYARLAETSEKSAREAQNLAAQIQNEVKAVTDLISSAARSSSGEAEKSQTVILALSELRKEIVALAESSQAIANTAAEAETAAREAQKGAEIISSAAEEQAAAAAEALRSCGAAVGSAERMPDRDPIGRRDGGQNRFGQQR